MRTRKDIEHLMKAIFEDCMATREAGQKEYAHQEGNAFENFDVEAKALGVDRKVVWSILAGKHWRGIRAYVLGHKSQRENVRGRIKDVIVYLVLLWGMIDDEEESEYVKDNAMQVGVDVPSENHRLIKEAIGILQGVR